MPERLAITTARLTLGGWFVLASTARTRDGRHLQRQRRQSRASRAPLAAQLARQGIASLLFDYRGYGGNPGAPSEGARRPTRARQPHLSARALTWTGTGSSISASRLGAGSRWASRPSGRHFALDPALAVSPRSSTWAAFTIRSSRSVWCCAGPVSRPSPGSPALESPLLVIATDKDDRGADRAERACTMPRPRQTARDHRRHAITTMRRYSPGRRVIAAIVEIPQRPVHQQSPRSTQRLAEKIARTD